MTAPNDASLSKRLEAVMALVDKATHRPWCAIDGPRIVHDPDVNVYRGHIADFVEEDDAAASAAAVNLLRQHGPALAELARRVEGDECEWSLDESSFAWDSSCGELWQFNDGGPEDNNVRFCHGCGKRVRLVPVEDGDE